MVRISDGQERLDLSKVWEAPRQATFRDVRPWLYLALLVGVLLEALTTRMGSGLPTFARSRAPVATAAPAPRIEKPVPVAEKAIVTEPDDVERRRERFARAKRSGDQN